MIVTYSTLPLKGAYLSLGTSVEKLNDLSETYKEMLGIFLQTLKICRLVLLFKYNFRAAEKSSLDCIMCSSLGFFFFFKRRHII